MFYWMRIKAQNFYRPLQKVPLCHFLIISSSFAPEEAATHLISITKMLVLPILEFHITEVIQSVLLLVG